ncbi:mandelate racemase/muconate lactonizing enzyme family protein [Sediminivirga luteola]|uniref:mandelate racemase/muconate lactonizing enzyme family protein n=1 Tax=Sediminivirga luteola TaxID=1774748 RepID=UPI001F55E5DD|nr:mandelate racemase/muconate lactonizing enzyme family protein [Sediminivirga luteola]MCI2266746.1 mandelate racemase/muconate lactonizing enzyme family protein [Sediminivirga luteola]
MTPDHTIVRARARLVEIPVETPRSDAIQSFRAQETPLVEIVTADGLVGTGYSYTIGTGGSAVMALLRDVLLPRLIGADSRRIDALWHTLRDTTRSTTPGTLTALALAAVDTALWDLLCRRRAEPLWIAAGGHHDRTEVYDTENGWLHLDGAALVDGVLSVKERGWNAAKVKVGRPTLGEDMDRLRAVRQAVGDDFALFVDANQGFTLPEAIRRARAFEEVGVAWLEEPLPSEDVEDHAFLAARTSIPIAVGETLTTVPQFRAYLQRHAASIVQVDAARIGGITPWLKVAHLSEAANVPVCPHFLMELHLGLTCAVSNGAYVEYIPQLRGITRDHILVEDRYAVASDAPGLGIDWDRQAIDRMTVGEEVVV